ncbi:hypothetical protein ACQP1K_09055 [Sphaerimonospora sp. CA-214678]|uniref:hypothetical protein n=1 Tax=Sphaerimonospora sp. CA-214678 TaxID=3240029 RepID=UPI003D9443EA
MKYSETDTGPAAEGPGTDSARSQALLEIKRQRRLVDQMATAHSLLRDQYRRRATSSTCVLLVASVVATAFAFAAGDTEVTIIMMTADRSVFLGWFAVLTFSLTLIDLVLDWRGSARSHEDAVRQLSALKAEYRTPPAEGEELLEREHLSQRYQTVMEALPPIPAAKFAQLKARHLKMIEVSRILSERPGISVRKARRELRKRWSDKGTPPHGMRAN